MTSFLTTKEGHDTITKKLYDFLVEFSKFLETGIKEKTLPQLKDIDLNKPWYSYSLILFHSNIIYNFKPIQLCWNFEDLKYILIYPITQKFISQDQDAGTWKIQDPDISKPIKKNMFQVDMFTEDKITKERKDIPILIQSTSTTLSISKEKNWKIIPDTKLCSEVDRNNVYQIMPFISNLIYSVDSKKEFYECNDEEMNKALEIQNILKKEKILDEKVLEEEQINEFTKKFEKICLNGKNITDLNNKGKAAYQLYLEYLQDLEEIDCQNESQKTIYIINKLDLKTPNYNFATPTDLIDLLQQFYQYQKNKLSTET